MRFYLSFCLYFIILQSVSSQDFFDDGFNANEPVQDRSEFSFDSLVSIHTAYLNDAIDNNDSLKQLYGLGYLVRDYMIHGDFVKGKSLLIEIEKIAVASNNAQWMGWMAHGKGILSLRLGDREEALVHYTSSVRLCKRVQDELCIAQGLEQIGSIYSYMGQLDSATAYFEVAWPLIRKYGSPRSIGATSNNYATLLLNSGKPDEAVPYYKQVIQIFDSIGQLKPKAQGMNNLAAAYIRSERYVEAKKILDQCIQLNTSNGLPENLITNYKALHEMAILQDDFRSAHRYLQTYTSLQDSLLGVETRTKIIELEDQFKSQQQSLELAQKDRDLLATRSALSFRNTIIILGAMTLIAMGLLWWFRERSLNNLLVLKRENLDNATTILKDKNMQLRQLKEALTAAHDSSDSEAIKMNLFNLNILTDEDWNNFLGLFEGLYPNYISRLRQSDLQLSPAEERLFLLLKLKRSRSEIAEVLGVSSDSVKKTRNRLRKRIGLSEGDELEDFIYNF